ncbi:transposase [Eubacterium sp. BX4]|uniref:Transposase n=1 Tax=Eubacterium segne TaxID=2763045 RepID=A0ABR7F3K5_9FIRM|nr:transposase [Eubacterium segne]
MMCKYHIVFIPKYMRKAIYGAYRENTRDILIKLCEMK